MLTRVLCLLFAAALFVAPALADEVKPEDVPAAPANTRADAKEGPEEPMTDSRMQMPDTPQQHPELAPKEHKGGAGSAKADGAQALMGVRLSPESAFKKGAATNFKLSFYDKDHPDIRAGMLADRRGHKLQILAVDESLTDFQNIFPEENKDGGWTFSLSPATEHSYRLWAEFQLKDGEPEVFPLEVRGAEPCKEPCAVKTESTAAEAGGFKATLSFENDAHAGDNLRATLELKDKDGKDVKDLEPLMGAYAHAVAVPEDLIGIVQAYSDQAPKLEADRGASPLTMTMYAPRAGFTKLFVTIRAGGKDILLPFGLTVKDAGNKESPKDAPAGDAPSEDTAAPKQ